MNRHQMFLSTALLLFFLQTMASSVTFAEETPTKKFWGGIELGVGSVHLNADDVSTDSVLYLNFKFGAVLSKQWILGIELGGYSLEYGNLNDPSEGAGISQIFLVAQYYFKEEQNSWYVKAGGGYLSLWDNNEPKLEESGIGTMVGLGYNWQTKGWGCLGPLVIIGYGKTGNLDHTSITIALNWSSF